MSKIIIQCEQCDTEREVDEKMAGSVITCSSCGENIRIPIPNVYEGVEIGGFVLEKQLGFGAMGEVWLAHQKSMDRKVALKLLSHEFTLDSQFVDRFLKEVRMSAKMDHTNIITAFDAGFDKDIHYLAISYVDGEDLDQRLVRMELLPEKEALNIVHEISQALCYAWNEFKILHRDLKPSNIMIDKYGSAKLMDMGISKSVNEESQLTMTGTVIGTPYYMSPEQGMGEPDLDCRSDIYSLGATLYHLVTGAFPFEATTAIGIISKHITEPLPPPQNTNPNLSDECSALLEIMMGKKRTDRQQTWEEVIKDIELVLKGEMPNSKRRPKIGDSVIRRAISDDDIPRDEKEVPIDVNNSVTSDEDISLRDKGSVIAENTNNPKINKKLMFGLSIASIIIIIFAAILVLTKGDNGKRDIDEFEIDNSTLDLMDDADVKAKPPPIHQIIEHAPPERRNNIKEVDKEKRYKEMWLFATNFLKKNPDNYNMAISNFEELSRSATGSKYKMMADVEIDNLFKKQDQAIKLIMTTLSNKSKKMIANNEFHKAAEIYNQYAGKLENETFDIRVQMMEDLIKQGDDFEQLKFEKEEAEREKNYNNVSSILELIIADDIKTAREKFKAIGKQSQLPEDMKIPIEQLLFTEKRVIESFAKDMNKQIIISFKKGKIRGTVKKIKNKYIYIAIKKGKIVVQKRFPLDQLSNKEFIKRAKLDKPATLILKSISAAKRDQIDAAIQYSGELKGELSVVFIDVMQRHFFTEEVEDDINVDQADDPHSKSNENNHQVVDNNNFDNKRRPIREQQNSEPGHYRKLHDKLEKVNHNYDRRGRFRGDHGRIEEADFFESNGIDNKSLTVIGKLPDLRVLDLGRSHVTDISPLVNLKLEMLMLGMCHNLKDITPLKKIKSLKELLLFKTSVDDISSLKGLSLEKLDISKTKVSDISALKNMPLFGLRLMDCNIKDYSVLKTLKQLQFLEPIHLWKHIPGKEHLANRVKKINKRKKNINRIKDNRFDKRQF